MQRLPNQQHQPQQFPHGFRPLLVGSDYTTLKNIETMCFRCNYNVSMCSEAAFAMNLLRERKECFDMVLSDDHMVDMDAFTFIQFVVQETNLPVVVISSDERPTSVIKVLTIGACDYLIKPISEEVIKNIWKHVWQRHYMTKIESENLGNNINERRLQGNPNPNYHDDAANATSLHDRTIREEGLVNEARTKRSNSLLKEDDGELVSNEAPPVKKRRVIWTDELHGLFINAVQQLGLSKAVPKAILELMNVQGLMRENVASHLQKYKINLKRLYEESQRHHQQTANEMLINTSSGSAQSILERLQMEALAPVVHHPNLLAHHHPNSNVESSGWSHNPNLNVESLRWSTPNVTVPSLGPYGAISNLIQHRKIPLNILRHLHLHPQKRQENLTVGESTVHQQLQNSGSDLSHGTKCDPTEVNFTPTPYRNQEYVIPNMISPLEMKPSINDLSQGNISGIHNSGNTLYEPNTFFMDNTEVGFLPDSKKYPNVMDYLTDN